jgi:hypothetical protein
MSFSRFSFFAVILIPLLVFPQNVEAQEYKTSGFSWAEIDFRDTDQFELIEKTGEYIILTESVPNRKRLYLAVNAEFATGRAQMTERMQQSLKAAKDSLRGIISRSHVVKVVGTNNEIPNNQQAELPQTEKSWPEQQVAADADLGETRSDIAQAAIVEVVYGTALNPSKIEGGSISMVDRLQSMEGLSDIQSLLARKSFVVIAEEYKQSASNNEEFNKRLETVAGSLQQQIDKIKDRVSKIETAVTNLEDVDDHQNREIDSLQTAVRNISPENGIKSSITAGARYDLGLATPTISGSLVVPNGVVLSVNAGLMPSGVNSRLCKGDVKATSRITAGSSVGYAWQATDNILLEPNAGFQWTSDNLEEVGSINFFAVSAGLKATISLSDHVGLTVGGTHSKRTSISDGVESIKKPSPWSVHGGITISF